jgi:hypothetical protein
MIRLWKLGNLEHKIVPTKEASEKLASILKGHTGSETMDLIWGPDIEVEIVPDQESLAELEEALDLIHVVKKGDFDDGEIQQ